MKQENYVKVAKEKIKKMEEVLIDIGNVMESMGVASVDEQASKSAEDVADTIIGKLFGMQRQY